MCRTSRAAKRREQVIAGALAPAALLGGQTAVLMVMGVTLALRGARATRGQACLQRRELRVRVRVGLAAEDAAGVNACVGAIEAEPDAGSQRFNIGLGEARVGADRARRRARGALVDAGRERGDVGDEWTPMRAEDLSDTHVLSFRWTRFFRRSRAAAQMTIDTATTPAQCGERSVCWMHCRMISVGRSAWCTIALETLPRNIGRRPVSPRDPMTMVAASWRSAISTIVFHTDPVASTATGFA